MFLPLLNDWFFSYSYPIRKYSKYSLKITQIPLNNSNFIYCNLQEVYSYFFFNTAI